MFWKQDSPFKALTNQLSRYWRILVSLACAMSFNCFVTIVNSMGVAADQGERLESEGLTLVMES